MRKNVLLSALLIISLSLGAVAEEKPSASSDSPFIFVNTNSPYGYKVAINSEYSSFAHIARSMGFDIDHGHLNEITDEFLEDVDIFGPGSSWFRPSRRGQGGVEAFPAAGRRPLLHGRSQELGRSFKL